MKTLIQDETQDFLASAIFLALVLMFFGWLLVRAPAHDEKLFDQQQKIQDCRDRGSIPVIIDGEIQCHPLRQRRAR